MIDNRLKNCCNDCNHIDAFADTTEEIGYRIEGCCTMQPNAVRVLIGCKHMYVCKAYIESRDVEEVDMSLERKTMKEIMENIEKNGIESAFGCGKIPEFRKGGTLDC